MSRVALFVGNYLMHFLKQVEFFNRSMTRTRIKISATIESLKTYFEKYLEYDPMITQPLPNNPWITDDQTFWHHNSPMYVKIFLLKLHIYFLII